MPREVGKLFVTIGADLNSLRRSLNTARMTIQNWAKKMVAPIGRILSRIWTGFVRAAKLAAVAAVAAFALMIKKSIQLGSSAEETRNLFEVTFKGLTGEAQKFVYAMAKLMRRDPLALMEMMPGFYKMAEGMGVAADQSLALSKNMTRLVYGFSSLRNIPESDAARRLMAGLSGEVEPLRRYGIDLRVEAVERAAVTRGIVKQGEKLSALGQFYVRYNMIVEKLNEDMGDEIRTRDSVMNQMRSIRDIWNQFTRSIYGSVVEGKGFRDLLRGIREGLHSLISAMPNFGSIIQKFFSSLGQWLSMADLHLREFAARWEWAGNVIETAARFIVDSVKMMYDMIKATFSGGGFVDNVIEDTVYDFKQGLRQGIVDASKIVPGLGQFAEEAQRQISADEKLHRSRVAERTSGVSHQKIWSEYLERGRQSTESFRQANKRFESKLADIEIERARRRAKWEKGEGGIPAIPPLESLPYPMTGMVKEKTKGRYKIETLVPRWAEAAGGLGIESFATRERVSRMRTEGAFGPRMRIVDTELQQLNEQKKTNELLERYLNMMHGKETLDVWG